MIRCILMVEKPIFRLHKWVDNLRNNFICRSSVLKHNFTNLLDIFYLCLRWSTSRMYFENELLSVFRLWNDTWVFTYRHLRLFQDQNCFCSMFPDQDTELHNRTCFIEVRNFSPLPQKSSKWKLFYK